MSSIPTNGSMALLALTHTPAEHKLYEALLAATEWSEKGEGIFSLRQLKDLACLGSGSTLRRARAGLVAKMSIDCEKVKANGQDGCAEEPGAKSLYTIYLPDEVFERRRAAGLQPYPKEFRWHAREDGFSVAIERVAGIYDLSRREAQVALCCAEGLTNGEIGERLFITEQTVKFHLRHVFAKFGVKRRGELISRLLRRGLGDGSGDGPVKELGFTGEASISDG